MMMYHVSEEHILTTWSLETLIKKIKHGFNFILLKLGVPLKDEKPENLSDTEIVQLYN